MPAGGKSVRGPGKVAAAMPVVSVATTVTAISGSARRHGARRRTDDATSAGGRYPKTVSATPTARPAAASTARWSSIPSMWPTSRPASQTAAKSCSRGGWRSTLEPYAIGVPGRLPQNY